MARHGWHQDHETADHIKSTVDLQQREMDAGTQRSSFLFSTGPPTHGMVQQLREGEGLLGSHVREIIHH